MKVDSVVIGTRHRKDLGDLDALAASLKDVGLLHPIVVTVDRVLVAGERRLAAARKLGWAEIPATIATTIAGAAKALRAERDENLCRKDFSPTEAATLADQLMALERPKAAERMMAGRPPVNFTEGGETRQKVAEAVGMSTPTLAKAQAVVAAARSHPATYGSIAEEMDRTGKVTPAYNALHERATRPEAPPVHLPHKPVVSAPPPRPAVLPPPPAARLIEEPDDEELDEDGKPYPPVPAGSIKDDAVQDTYRRSQRLVDIIRGAIIGFTQQGLIRDMRSASAKAREMTIKDLHEVADNLAELTKDLEKIDEACKERDRTDRRKAI